MKIRINEMQVEKKMIISERIFLCDGAEEYNAVGTLKKNWNCNE